MEESSPVAGLMLIVAIVIIYFIPALTAYQRSHHNRGAILALNLFAGWTALGWLIALVWSLTAVKGAQAPADG